MSKGEIIAITCLVSVFPLIVIALSIIVGITRESIRTGLAACITWISALVALILVMSTNINPIQTKSVTAAIIATVAIVIQLTSSLALILYERYMYYYYWIDYMTDNVSTINIFLNGTASSITCWIMFASSIATSS